MYKDKNILTIIPARGGSKGLPGKNVKKLSGRPLIVHTIEQAKKSEYIDRVIVSTDDIGIADISKEHGAEVPFIRPEELATDDSSIFDVLLHSMEWMEKKEEYSFEIVVLLHATAPLRSVEDIDNSIRMLVDKNADNVFSVTEAHRNPYFNMVEVSGQTVRLVKEGTFINRQDAPQVYDMNASIYVWWKDILKDKKNTFLDNSRIYVMPKDRSVDIDDYMDFKIAEMISKQDMK